MSRYASVKLQRGGMSEWWDEGANKPAGVEKLQDEAFMN